MAIAAVLIKKAHHRIAARAGVAVGAMRPGGVAPVIVRAAEAAPGSWLAQRGSGKADHQGEEGAPTHLGRLTRRRATGKW